MPNFDSFSDLLVDVLFRLDEPATGSDFDAAAQRAIVRAFHDFNSFHPWWWNRIYPPGVFNTVDDITTLTITAGTAGTGVTATLSAAPGGSVSIANRKILPSGVSWFARVTAHTGGSTTVTLDAVPTTLAAGTAITIVQDEYELAADLGLFVDGLWTENGYYVELKDEEFLRKEYGDLPSPAWPPSAFCRLTTRRIRLSHYPTGAYRVEYPYTVFEADPSGTGDLTIARPCRPYLADGALYFAYLMKSDKRAGEAKRVYEEGKQTSLSLHRRVMMGIGSNPGSMQRSPYA